MRRSGSKPDVSENHHITFSVTPEEVHEIPAYWSSDSEEDDEINHVHANKTGLNQSGRCVDVSASSRLL